MTDREKFQKTFEKLHASPEILLEVLNMTTEEKKISMKNNRLKARFAAAAAAVVIVVGTGSMVYAKDIGGIQRKVQVWIHGDQTDATFTVENGSYTLHFPDEDGNDVERSGGGIAYNKDGTERPLTEEELWDEINSPEVVYEEDGSVWVYYLEQKIEITDKFEDGVCYLKLEVDDEIQYMTIEYQKGYSMSPHGYIQP